MADKATPPKNYDEHERCRSAANFFFGGLIEGRQHECDVVGSPVGGGKGANTSSGGVVNRQAVAVEATAPENHEGPGMGGSTANCFVNGLIKNNFHHCYSPFFL